MAIRVVSVLALLLLTAVPVDAQLPEPQWSLEVGQPEAAVQPIEEVVERDYTLVLLCEPGTARASGAPIKVDLESRSSEEWAVVTTTPATHHVNATQDACLAGDEFEVTGAVAVALTKDAPAGARTTVTLTATPTEGEPVTASWNETAGVYLNAQARFTKTIWKASPSSEVHLPLVIENFGNGPIRATVALGADANTTVNITFPDAVEVPPGESKTVELQANTASAQGYINRQDEVRVEVHLLALDDTALTQVIPIAAIIQTQGTDVVEGPGPAPLLFLGLLALLGLHRRATRSTI